LFVILNEVESVILNEVKNLLFLSCFSFCCHPEQVESVILSEVKNLLQHLLSS